MPVVDVYNLQREKVGEVDLSDEIFGVEVRPHLWHEVVRAQLATKRGGNAKTKERNEIAGTQAKVWRQKGTGRARQGDRKGGHWRGGGVIHGPRVRDFAIKVNKKTRRAALLGALTKRQQDGALIVVDDFAMSEIKTRQVADVLTRFETSKALIVDLPNETLAKSANNLVSSAYLAVGGLNVYDVLYHDTLILTRAALNAIQGEGEA